MAGTGRKLLQSAWLVNHAQLRRATGGYGYDDGGLIWSEWLFGFEGSGSFTAGAVIVAGYTIETGSFTADAVRLGTRGGSLSASAIIARTQGLSATAESVVRKGQTGSLTANAVVFRTQPRSFSANAVIKSSASGSLPSDAITRVARTFSRSNAPLGAGSVEHDAFSESHTGSTGSASEASFTWSHTPVGTPRGVLVTVVSIDTSTSRDTGVTYGGTPLRMLECSVSSGSAENFAIQTWFLGSGVPTGQASVVVSRENSATVLYATCVTVTAPGDTWVPPSWETEREPGVYSEVSIDDGSLTAAASQRYAVCASGVNAASSVVDGANSTRLGDITPSGYANSIVMVRETVPGSGSRPVGVTAVSDDRCAVWLAVAAVPPDTAWHDTVSASPSSLDEPSFTWSHNGGSDPKGVFVAVLSRGTATPNDIGVTYGGVAMTLDERLTVGSSDAADTVTRVYWLGLPPPGARDVVVSRANSHVTLLAYCVTVNGDRECEIVSDRAVFLTGVGTLSEQEVSDLWTSNSQRYALGGTGLNAPPLDGAHSRTIASSDGLWTSAALAVEKTPGNGARPVGFSDASDDRAFVHFAVQLVPLAGQGPTADAVIHKVQAGSLTADAVVRRGQTGSFTADAIELVTFPRIGDLSIAAHGTPANVAVPLSVEARSADGGTTRYDIYLFCDGGDGDHVWFYLTEVEASTEHSTHLTIVDLGYGNYTTEWQLRLEVWGAPGDVTVRGKAWRSTGDAEPDWTTASGTYALIPRSDATATQNATIDWVRGAPTISANAVIGRTQTGSLAADAIVARAQAGSITASATLLSVGASSISADAVLAVVTQTISGSLPAAAVIKKSVSNSATSSAILLASSAATLSVSAIIRSSSTTTFTAAATLLSSTLRSVTGDAVVRSPASGVASLDAVTRATQPGFLTTDAIIARPQTGSFSAAAVIKRSQPGSALADAIRLKTMVFGSAGGTTEVLRDYDTFTDADEKLLASHAPDTGGPWVAGSAGLLVRSNEAQTPYSFGSPYNAQEGVNTLPGLADGYVQATLIPTTFSTFPQNYYVSLGLRSNSIASPQISGYWISKRSSFTSVDLYREGGVLIGSFTATGQTYRIKATGMSPTALAVSEWDGSSWVEKITLNENTAGNQRTSGYPWLALKGVGYRAYVGDDEEGYPIYVASGNPSRADNLSVYQIVAGGVADGPGPTLDAIIRKTQSASLTAAAVVKCTQSTSLTANAVLRMGASGVLSASSVLHRSAAFTMATGAWIHVPSVGFSVAADAAIRRSQSGSFGAASWLRGTGFAALTGDAVIRSTRQNAISTNAVLRASWSGTFTSSAALRDLRSGSASASAIILKTASAQLTAQSVLRAPRTVGVTADAVILSPRTGTLSVAASISGPTISSFSARAVVSSTQIGACQAAAILRAGRAGDFSANAILRASSTKAFGASASLSGTQERSFVTEAVLRGGRANSLTAAALLRRSSSITFTAGATTLRTASGSISLDAVVAITHGFDFGLAAVLSERRPKRIKARIISSGIAATVSAASISATLITVPGIGATLTAETIAARVAARGSDATLDVVFPSFSADAVIV